jgi:hypothetical protein
MGTRLSKLPDQDVAEPESRRRMELMARLGHRYIVTCLGRPRVDLPPEALRAAGIAAIEVNTTLATFERQKGALREWRQTTGTQVYFSKIHTFDDSHFDGKHFSHFVKAGLTLDELERSVEIVRGAIQSGAIDGVTVRVEPEEDLLDAADRIARFGEHTGAQVLASLKTSGPNLATERADDRAFVQRVAHAMLLSRTSSRVRFVFDTFMDVDRGYYPRHAFIDRRFDARPAARAFTTLTALLGTADIEVQRSPSTGTVRVRSGDSTFELLCCSTAHALGRVAASPAQWVHDLVEGTRHERSACVDALKQQGASAESLQVLLLESRN